MNILVTAGPTHEAIDPVRFITNRSTGKMGYAVAEAAMHHGHNVTLVSGPVHLSPPKGARVRNVETADDMLRAVHDEMESCDALVMTAAVADWTPEVVETRKKKKSNTSPILNLRPTVDILLSLKDLKGDRTFVGFAAETDHMMEEARRKLEEKNLDLVVANDVTEDGSGFAVDTNKVTFIMKNGEHKELPMMSKYDVAEEIVQWLSSQRDA